MTDPSSTSLQASDPINPYKVITIERVIVGIVFLVIG